MKILSSEEYLNSMQHLLRKFDIKYFDYKNLYWKIIDNHTYLIFNSNNVNYYLTCNSSCMFVGYLDKLLNNDFSTIHNVPLMLSDTDYFMMCFLKIRILNHQRLTLFDFANY